MIPAADFERILAGLRVIGYADDDIEWAQNCCPPPDAEVFAWEVIFVICNSGMKNTVARGIFNRCRTAIQGGASAGIVFGHKGKSAAIDKVWIERAALFAGYIVAADPLAFLAALPWIGDITKYHLARNFGLDYAKPDVHLQRLADLHSTTPQLLCADLAAQFNLRIGTIDTLLWRACAEGIVNSRTGEIKGDR